MCLAYCKGGDRQFCAQFRAELTIPTLAVHLGRPQLGTPVGRARPASWAPQLGMPVREFGARWAPQLITQLGAPFGHPSAPQLGTLVRHPTSPPQLGALVGHPTWLPQLGTFAGLGTRFTEAHEGSWRGRGGFMGMGGVGEELGEVFRRGLRSSWGTQLVTPHAPVGQLSWAPQFG